MNLLDCCFGLGYNSLVLLENLIRIELTGSVSVIAVETDPEIIALIPTVLEDARFSKLRAAAGTDAFSQFGTYAFQAAKANFTVQLVQEDLRRFVASAEGEFDLVFHDAFSPRKVPELWTVDVFRHYYRLLHPAKGSLLTYSLAGAVQGGLKESGFELYRTTPVGEKKGGTLATTDPDFIPRGGVAELTPDDTRKLQSRSGVPYRDRSLNASRGDILAAREAEQASLYRD